MSDLSIQPTNVQQKKKMSPVKKGALIGAGAEVASRALLAGLAIKSIGKDQFVNCIKTAGVGKYAGRVALGIGITSAIGAGIGKIVEICKNKKAQKTQAEG